MRESTLYIFDNGAAGAYPSAFIQDSDGNLFGTARSGGVKNENCKTGCGVVFEINEAVLYSFMGGSFDGASPSGLIQGSDGNFYGTTQNGGQYAAGTVFKVTATGVETVLCVFGGSSINGTYPSAGVIQASDGNFYGTTLNGGQYGIGTVFEVTPTGEESILYTFGKDGGSSDGANPAGGLIQGVDGNFYGTTQSGGQYGLGTVFKLTPAGAETILHSFSGGAADGNEPVAALIQANDGNLYGTTASGGAITSCAGCGIGGGTAFKVTTAGLESVLHSFGAGSDGSLPGAPLVQGIDGNLYGTTVFGGQSGNGTVFRLSTSGTETVLYSFAGGTTDGASPSAIIQAKNGNFYGITNGGGEGYGTEFELVLPTN